MREYLIEKILPSRELHLIGGPSGAGKTRLLFQWLRDWQANKPFFFNPKTNEPFNILQIPKIAYIAYDRSAESVQETMESIGEIPNLRAKSMRDHVFSLSHLEDFAQDASLIVFDAIACAVPNGKTNDYVTVAGFCRSLGVYCSTKNVTMIGIHHTAKVKENERYLNPRQKLSGSGSWAQFSDTVMILEPTKPDDPNVQSRELSVLPRNSAEYRVEYEFHEGILIPKLAFVLSQAERVILDLISSAGNGKIRITNLIEDAKLFGIAEYTFRKAIERLVELQVIVNLEHGYVQKRG